MFSLLLTTHQHLNLGYLTFSLLNFNVSCIHEANKRLNTSSPYLCNVRMLFMNTLEVETVVPGHGEICGKDEIGRFIDYMRSLWSITGDLVERGVSCEEAVRKVAEEMFGHFEIEPARLEAARIMFDRGTERLYREIVERQGAGSQ